MFNKFNNKKNKDKFDLYKICPCNKKKPHCDGNKKQATSYDAIKENVTHDIPSNLYRK
jgi:CDGSH-type Zn-finger protein